MFIYWQVKEMGHCTLVSPTTLSKGYMNIKNGLIEGFSKKYGVHMLVYYEQNRSHLKKAKWRMKIPPTPL